MPKMGVMKLVLNIIHSQHCIQNEKAGESLSQGPDVGMATDDFKTLLMACEGHI